MGSRVAPPVDRRLPAVPGAAKRRAAEAVATPDESSSVGRAVERKTAPGKVERRARCCSRTLTVVVTFTGNVLQSASGTRVGSREGSVRRVGSVLCVAVAIVAAGLVGLTLAPEANASDVTPTQVIDSATSTDPQLWSTAWALTLGATSSPWEGELFAGEGVGGYVANVAARGAAALRDARV